MQSELEKTEENCSNGSILATLQVIQSFLAFVNLKMEKLGKIEKIKFNDAAKCQIIGPTRTEKNDAGVAR